MTGQELKQIRNDLGFTQVIMSELLNISKGYYRRLEQEQKPITDEISEKVYKLFNAPTETTLQSQVDWLKIRFKTLNYRKVIEDIFCLKLSDFYEAEKSFYGYSNMLTRGSFRVLYSEDVEKIDSGVMLEFTGTACRELEMLFLDQKIDWFIFLERVFLFGENNKGERELEDFMSFPRFDLALDEVYKSDGNISLEDFKDRVFDYKVKLKKLKTFQHVGGLKKINGEFVNQGITLYFGSRQSEVMFRFYQKDYEQAIKKNVSIEYIHEAYKYKNRYEIEFHDSKAFDVLKIWSETKVDLTEIGVRVINNYFEVMDWKGNYDTEWAKLIGTPKGFQFIVRPQTADYNKTKNWISQQVSSALKLLKVVDEVYKTDELSEIISEAYMSNNHLKLAEEICERNGCDLEEIISKIE